jgi:hypothetical protein
MYGNGPAAFVCCRRALPLLDTITSSLAVAVATCAPRLLRSVAGLVAPRTVDGDYMERLNYFVATGDEQSGAGLEDSLKRSILSTQGVLDEALLRGARLALAQLRTLSCSRVLREYGVRDASYPPLIVPRDVSWEKSRATACRWVTGSAVVRLDAADNVSAARRSRRVECRYRLACGRRVLRLRRANRSGLGCFSPRIYGPAASKQLHVTWAIVEEWRSIATRDEINLRSIGNAVNLSDCGVSTPERLRRWSEQFQSAPFIYRSSMTCHAPAVDYTLAGARRSAPVAP